MFNVNVNGIVIRILKLFQDCDTSTTNLDLLCEFLTKNAKYILVVFCLTDLKGISS